MRKLVVGTFVTLDGVMQGPGGPEEDRSGGFEHGGWLVPYFDEAMGEVVVRNTQRADGVILGRKTYEIFAAHWPHIGDDDPIAAKLNRVPKYVASRTLKRLEWKNSTLLEGDVAQGIERLKREGDGELQVTGSADLIQTLLGHNLVDEFWLFVFPLVLGKGKRLFGDGTMPTGLELLETRSYKTGVMLQAYRKAGALRYGSFMLEQPTEAELARRRKVEREG